jgi:putative transcriptional regulator
MEYIMNSIELRAIRASTGLSQAGLAEALGISRKTYNELEGGATIDQRTRLAMETLARKVKLIRDAYWVEESAKGTWIVIRRTEREIDRPNALYWGQAELMLYGEFANADHAYRWAAALRRADNPRNTRKLERAREAEAREREAIDA